MDNMVCRLACDGQVPVCSKWLGCIYAGDAQGVASYDEYSPRLFQIASTGSARLSV